VRSGRPDRSRASSAHARASASTSGAAMRPASSPSPAAACLRRLPGAATRRLRRPCDQRQTVARAAAQRRCQQPVEGLLVQRIGQRAQIGDQIADLLVAPEGAYGGERAQPAQLQRPARTPPGRRTPATAPRFHRVGRRLRAPAPPHAARACAPRPGATAAPAAALRPPQGAPASRRRRSAAAPRRARRGRRQARRHGHRREGLRSPQNARRIRR